MKFPPKLKPGDTIRVVPLSGPIEWAKPDKLAAAEQFFAAHNIRVTYAEHMHADAGGPLPVVDVQHRVKDFELALADPNVRAVWALSGGENSNQILQYLEVNLFKDSNKMFVGHSDLTVVLNALAEAAGVATYYGPNFHAIGSKKGIKTTHEFLEQCLFNDFAYELEPVKTWHDKDYSVQPPVAHSHHEPKGWWPIQTAGGAGQLVGGEISTFALLQGTKFFPNLKGKIVALEMYMGDLAHFDRLFESLLMQKGADKLEGVILGRFQSSANITEDALRTLIASKPILQGLPVIANVDFGHTTPRITLPIGGHVQLRVSNTKQQIRIGEH